MYFFWMLSMTLTIIIQVDAYEECQGDYCPPALIKAEEISLDKEKPILLGTDKKTGCICMEKLNFTICFGRLSCTSMQKSLPIRTEILKITNTHIKEFNFGDFSDLDHLVAVEIDGNYDLQKISSGALQNLKNLVNLTISYNSKLKLIEKDAFLGLENLKQLYLNNNAFETLYSISYSLRSEAVPNLSTLILDSNNFLQISANDFLPMENTRLKELSLVLCRIEYIHPNAMDPLGKLESLQLGENIINSSVLQPMFESMIKTNINLKTLHLFYMGFKKMPPKSVLQVIARSKVSHINLSKNQFELLSRDSFPEMKNIEILDLRETFTINITDDAFVNLPNLRNLLMSGNKLHTIPDGILLISQLSYLDIQENSPSGSYHLYFTLEPVDFKKMQELSYLNLGYNGMTHLYNTSFIGLKRLWVLKLKNSSIYHIEKGAFFPLESLRVLNLMNNPIAITLGSIPNVFSTLSKLEILYLGGCGLKYISNKSSPFKNLHSLKHLGLERNKITTISPQHFQFLFSVKKIDLSFNMLTSWSERILTYTNNLTDLSLAKNKLTDVTEAMFEDLVKVQNVDLDQNTFLCNCMITYRSYMKWRKRSNKLVSLDSRSLFSENVYCASPYNMKNETLVDYLTRTDLAAYHCTHRRYRLYIFLPLFCFLALIGVLLGLGFYYRWHIKYWIFLSKLYLSRTGKIRSKKEKKGYSNYEYDAFVSYSNEDRDFVVKLVNMLENYEPYFRLCVYERDFQIGTIISESVLESVAKSRKTVLVISDNYAKSQWCRWESQICEHHRIFLQNEDGEYVNDSLLLIKIGPVSDSNLTPTLKYLLKTRIYLHWEWDERKQDVFWTKLRNTLGVPLAEITRM